MFYVGVEALIQHSLRRIISHAGSALFAVFHRLDLVVSSQWILFNHLHDIRALANDVDAAFFHFGNAAAVDGVDFNRCVEVD